MTCLKPCSAQNPCPDCYAILEECERPIYKTKQPEKMKEPKCTLTDAELITACDKWIDKLCKTGGRAWTLQVPVKFNEDPDMLFSELIKRFKDAKP